MNPLKNKIYQEVAPLGEALKKNVFSVGALRISAELSPCQVCSHQKKSREDLFEAIQFEIFIRESNELAYEFSSSFEFLKGSLSFEQLKPLLLDRLASVIDHFIATYNITENIRKSLIDGGIFWIKDSIENYGVTNPPSSEQCSDSPRA